jgi:two-component system chemotaxis response regulator CheY
MNLLIVDDSKAMRSIIARALREMGVPGSPYLEASNGKAALETIAASAPEMVISDLNMPEMSGMQLLHALRDGGNATPFGLVTSEASAQLREEAAQAGALFVVTKPFTAANLNDTLGPHLAKLGCRTRAVDSDGPNASLNTSAKLPKPAQVGAVLEELLRRASNASLVPPAPPTSPRQIVAEYQTADDGSLAACVLCDLPFAIRAGAALTLVPRGAAEEAIQSKTVEDTIGENFREVLNVMARFLDHGGACRVHLDRVHMPGETLDAALMAHLSKPKARLDLSVDIHGYGKGSLTLISLRD